MKWLSWFTPKPFPPEAIEQLEDLGYKSEQNLEIFREFWRRDGERRFWNFLEHLRDIQKLQEEYEPRLRDYAAKCRLEKPPPITVKPL